ncbi:MAG TPA: homoserine dehydrogenase [Candidatus Tectomicrobia bacterium]|nr:homoserine dehydrogenase [Candidatus Tectomicrobia bacterium]
MQAVSLGVLGLGTVGSGVVKILRHNREVLERRVGIPLHVKRIAVRDPKAKRATEVEAELLTTDPWAIVRDPEIDVVVELMGGIEPAKSLILEAAAQGKQVVTANKALLAEAWQEVFTAVTRHGVDLGFEASVGGGIPIIRAIREGFVGNRIESIYGIVNGTSNYILTRMTDDGEEFRVVLGEAMGEGYAEPDPTLDIEGIDAAHKITVLATLAFGCRVPFAQVFIEGISGITPMDISYARELGYKVKSLAIAKQQDGDLEVRVHPTLIPQGNLLYGVDGVYNAITVIGDMVGANTFIGRGAGIGPSGSAVVGDIVDIARDLVTGGCGRVPPAGYRPGYEVELRLKPMEEVLSEYYLRFSVVDKPGVLSKISGVLGRHNISIASVIQKGRRIGETVPLVMMTHHACERDMQAALREIDQIASDVTAKTVLIRVENGA